MTVAITDAYASPTLLADSNRYAANHGLPKLVNGVNFSQIIPLGIYNVDPNETCGPTAGGKSSRSTWRRCTARRRMRTSSTWARATAATSLDIAFVNTVYNHVADIVTSSWGNNGEAIAPGIPGLLRPGHAWRARRRASPILFSSGDDGDLAALNGVASGSWPATSAWATGVGGTSLDDHGLDRRQGRIRLGHLSRVPQRRDGEQREVRDDLRCRHGRRTTAIPTMTSRSIRARAAASACSRSSRPTRLRPCPHYLATTLNLASGYTEPLPTRQRVSPDVAMDADPYTGYLYRRDLHDCRRSDQRRRLHADFRRPRSTARAGSAAPASPRR